MDDTLNKKINFYFKDNNNKTGINKEYISSDKYIKKDIEKKIYIRYNTPINKYKDDQELCVQIMSSQIYENTKFKYMKI